MSETTSPPGKATAVERRDEVVIRFAGDSGDGMQLTGGQFTQTSAIMGNDLATFPDFPAEIRAPAGTLPGVSAFQVRFSSFDIHNPGDHPDVLVAMNPAALKVHIGDLKPNGIVILNSAKFGSVDLKKAKYDVDPRTNGSLDAFRVVEIDLEKLTRDALATSPLDTRAKDRCKNMFALGVLYWLYNRDMQPTLDSIEQKFGQRNRDVADANQAVLRAGHAYAETTEVFQTTYEVLPATGMPPGRYRNIMGNQALCLGLVAASHKSGLPIMLGSYPITPASDILHQLSTYKNHGVMTFQAEDEIAAVCAAIGASYAGQIGVTSTSGPGLALKTEAVGLAVMTELPLVIVNVQRAGPSTGMPTKTEQADLLQSLYGRHGESPVGVIACSTPSDAFDCAFEAVRLSLTHMAPVILLSDGYIANGSEPWKIPAADSLPEIPVKFATERQDDEAPFLPYARDPKTLARPWAKPGTPGLMHRIGGLEKADGTGHISYDPQNHEHMVRMRAEKIERMADSIPEQDTLGPDSGDLLVLSWGGTRGAVTGAVQRLQKAGHKVSAASIRYLNPLPKNLGDLMRRFRRVCCVEINTGQLAMVLRARFLIDIQPVTKVQGQPFGAQELLDRLQAQLDAVGNAGANTNGV